MPNYPWEDPDQTGDGQSADPNPRDLRTQINELGAKLKERDKQIAELAGKIRSQNVKDILSSKLGLDARIAELIPDSVEPTEEAVKGWAEKFGDLFKAPDESGSASSATNTNTGGGDANKDEGKAAPNLTPEQIEAMQRVQSQAAAAGSTTPDVEAAQLDALRAAREAAGGSSDRFFEILNYGKPIT
jgi:hypothetical protein